MGELIQVLVEDIREESCLWSLKTKSNLEDQEDAWRRIAGKNKMTAIEAKLIFRELAKKYKEERKKPNSTWKLLQSLNFLDEDIEPRAPTLKPPSAPAQSVLPPYSTLKSRKPLPPEKPAVLKDEPKQSLPPYNTLKGRKFVLPEKPAEIKEEFLPDEFKVKEEPVDEIFTTQNASDEDVYVELLEVGDDSDTENSYAKDSNEFTPEYSTQNEISMEISKIGATKNINSTEVNKELTSEREREKEQQKEKEIERKQEKEKEIQLQKEIEIQKQKDKEMQKQKEREIQKQKDQELQNEKDKNSPARLLAENKSITILKPSTLNNTVLKSYSNGSKNDSNVTGRSSILSPNNSTNGKKVPLIFSGLKRRLANSVELKLNAPEITQPPEKQARISQEKINTSPNSGHKKISSTPPPALPLSIPIAENNINSIIPDNAILNQTVNISNDIEMITAASQIENSIINIGDVIPMPEVQRIKIEPADDPMIPILKPIPVPGHSRTYDSFGQYVSNTLSTLPTNLANKLEIKILEAIISINTEKMNAA